MSYCDLIPSVLLSIGHILTLFIWDSSQRLGQFYFESRILNIPCSWSVESSAENRTHAPPENPQWLTLALLPKYWYIFLVIVLNIHHKHTVSDVIPRWASYFIFEFLPKWIFIQGPTKSDKQNKCPVIHTRSESIVEDEAKLVSLRK